MITKMTFTGKRDNRKFNRIRSGYCILNNSNRIAKYVSYRRKKNGDISLSLLVDNGKAKEHDWQMIRYPLNGLVVGATSKEIATFFVMKNAGSVKK